MVVFDWNCSFKSSKWKWYCWRNQTKVKKMECNYQVNNFLELLTKGQSISKTIYGLLTSPKKRTDEFVLFAFLLFTANKSNLSVRFLGESTAHRPAFWFHLTFSLKCKWKGNCVDETPFSCTHLVNCLITAKICFTNWGTNNNRWIIFWYIF